MISKTIPLFVVSDNAALKAVMCFSLQTNYEGMISTHQKPSDIPSLHGIRALSALALIISHKVMALFYNPFMNRTKMADVSLLTKTRDHIVQ